LLRTASFLVVLTLFICVSCSTDKSHKVVLYEIPRGFPVMNIPKDNLPTKERIQLGKQLFFDTRLSKDNSISCGSCHLASKAMADSMGVSPGVEGALGNRNSISIVNTAYQVHWMREGGVPSLEMQVLAPIQDPNEMDFNIVNVVERLDSDSLLQELSQLAYSRAIDPFVITRAIACYERSLLSAESAYDRYIHQGDMNNFGEDEIAGMNLFLSNKTNCSSCHGGFNFTDNSFKNNGLYLTYADKGRERLTAKSMDRALFKVPSLRNVGLTAPYMHNGQFEDLDTVLNHYNAGGLGHPHQSDLVKPLNLSVKEIQQLKAFLMSLSDYTIAANPKFQED